jgi:hypothetical protein
MPFGIAWPTIASLVTDVLSIFTRTIFTSLIRRAREFGAERKPQCGAVSFTRVADQIDPEIMDFTRSPRSGIKADKFSSISRHCSVGWALGIGRIGSIICRLWAVRPARLPPVRTGAFEDALFDQGQGDCSLNRHATSAH